MKLNEIIESFCQKCTDDKFLKDISYLFSICRTEGAKSRKSFFYCLCYVYYIHTSNDYTIDIYNFDNILSLSNEIKSKSDDWKPIVVELISNKSFSIDGYDPDVKDFQECREAYQIKSTIETTSEKSNDDAGETSNIHDVADTYSSDEMVLDDIVLATKPYQRFDTSRVWKKVYDDCGRPMNMYATLPIIPKKQRDISVTTNVDRMSKSELLNLYPKTSPVNGFRSHPIFRQQYEGFTTDPIFGFIPKIEGFTEEQVIDNIIKYPSLDSTTRLKIRPKTTNMKYPQPFYHDIEIDGELIDCKKITEEICERIPDISRFIHAGAAYYPIIWDYIVRRYLLERDILHMEHKYPMYGDLQPFASLCLSADEYVKRGYTDDIEEFAYNHVKSRIHYLESINPVITKYEENSKNVLTYDPHQCMYCNICTEYECNFTCIKGVTSQYYVDASNFPLYSSEFMNFYTDEDFVRFGKIIKDHRRGYGVVVSKGRKYLSDAFFYAAMVIENYHSLYWPEAFMLNYRKYTDSYRRSWTTGEEPDSLQEARYNAEHCCTLIITGLDTMIFGDFESQTLLALLEDRNKAKQSTIIVMSDVDSINTNSRSTTTFVRSLREELRKRVISC